ARQGVGSLRVGAGVPHRRGRQARHAAPRQRSLRARPRRRRCEGARGVRLGWLVFLVTTNAFALVETPMLKDDVAAGKLPPVEKRLPQNPRVMPLEAGKTQGHHGGTLQSLAGRSRDTRLFTIYGYARLVVYTPDLKIVPDLVESFEAVEGRSFTFKLRKGHRWSDGQPFTTEDFRYYWEDVANNKELSPSGPPRDLLVDGEPPRVEIINETTVRYTWRQPNPSFLPRLAGTSPLFIFRPAHYLKQFHKKYSAKVAKADADGTAKRKW